MKKSIFFIVIAVFFLGISSCKSKKQTDKAKEKETATVIESMGDNSRVSLDWNGVYKGVVPCADCPGIEVSIVLNNDETYKISYRYIDKETTATTKTGKFVWDSKGNNIILKDLENAYPAQYKVGENMLFQLDMEGKVIEGNLADKYILTKVIQD